MNVIARLAGDAQAAIKILDVRPDDVAKQGILP
jgi:hypothetical protein